jgi:hypothetical protein
LFAVSLISLSKRNFFTYFLNIVSLQNGQLPVSSVFLKMTLVTQLKQQLCWAEQSIIAYLSPLSYGSEQIGQSNSICCLIKLYGLIFIDNKISFKKIER